MREIHLLCNAHLDPVWQWQWNEGAGAGLSTFRSAVEICEENDDLIFCHNEAHLYQIIEEYEPDLFARIQILVTKGQWHIMGGWYLQPDCNLPCGESFVRQMLIGRNYFFEKFHTVPKIAVNFDSFGHTRGLVQILKKGAYKGYVFMRPDARELDLPADDFAWIGVDGSVLPCHRIMPGYNSAMGEATDKIEQWIKKYPDTQKGLVTWGIGNHGGGPSRKDVKEIRATMIRHPEYKMHHSTPECYFCDTDEVRLLRYQGDLRPNQIGSYTSQQSIKKTYRLLENELWKTEKMLSAANLLGVMEYPENDLKQVQRDLLTAQFHDILAGTSIEPVEQDALRLMHHGLEILSRLATKAFFALCIGQPKALSDETPILILNPHPYPVEGIFCCEYSLEDQNWSEQFTVP
ncbi:MAG: alpha-mannosidase, partial [Ruthenibacterium sp.]